MTTARLFDIPDFQFVSQPELTAGEHIMLLELFTNPLVKKYLETLIANTIKSAVEIPLDTLANDGLITNAIKQAYIKGNLSILHTLYYLEKPQLTSVQATQQGQSQQT